MSKGTKIGLSVLASFFALVFIGIVWGYSYAVSIKNTGVRMEQQLSAQYESNQNYLSTFIQTFYETLDIADVKSDKMDEIIRGAVQGRYGEDGFSADGAFFSAVAEAYPDVSALNIYDDIVTQVQAGREGFRSRQDKIIDELRSYETWQREGFVRPAFISFIGFPTDQLQARIGGQVVARGQAALDQFHQIVLTGSTVEAFESGRQEPLQVPRN